MGLTDIHEGHRERMLSRLDRQGLEAFSPHEVLEILLFYAIPLRNVNPLAHQLMQRFGSLEGVLNAPLEQLATVPGMGEASARWLGQIPEILDVYGAQRLSDRPMLNRLKKAAAYGIKLFEGTTNPELWILNMSPAGHLLHSAPLASGADMLDTLDRGALMDTVLRYHAQCTVVMQNRDPEQMRLTERDVAFTGELNDMLGGIGVQLMDNVMIFGKRHMSVREKGVFQLRDRMGALMEPSFPNLALHWLDD